MLPWNEDKTPDFSNMTQEKAEVASGNVDTQGWSQAQLDNIQRQLVSALIKHGRTSISYEMSMDRIEEFAFLIDEPTCDPSQILSNEYFDHERGLAMAVTHMPGFETLEGGISTVDEAVDAQLRAIDSMTNWDPDNKEFLNQILSDLDEHGSWSAV